MPCPMAFTHDHEGLAIDRSFVYSNYHQVRCLNLSSEIRVQQSLEGFILKQNRLALMSSLKD